VTPRHVELAGDLSRASKISSVQIPKVFEFASGSFCPRLLAAAAKAAALLAIGKPAM